jgi:nitrate reductase beta subunit
MIVCSNTCIDSIRTIPTLQHDLDKAEDLDTEAEDHAADEWRYAIMSRPWFPREFKGVKHHKFTDYNQGRTEDDKDSWVTL